MKYLVAFILFLALTPASYAQLVAPSYTGTNMSVSDVKARLIFWGHQNKIPPMILFGIAQQESGWQQYIDEDGHGGGHTKYHFEPRIGEIGVGIMQITVSPNDSRYHDLCTNEDYNIQVGASILADKWANTPDIGDGHLDKGREKLENWYYAVWAYNSWGYVNNPNNLGNNTYPAQVPQYQSLIYDHISGRKPLASLAGLWVPCDITPPAPADIGSITTGATHGCGQTIAATPAPVHTDVNFDGVIDGTTGGGGSDTDIYVDKGNGASGQNGSAGNPFNTVKAAINAASATQPVTIHIKPGTYSEKIGTSKHIHFVTNGPGTVSIGG